MPLVSLTGLSLEIGDQPILQRAELTLDPGERVALIGRNGAGKSTLLRILEGDLKPDAGEIRAKPGLRISRLAQLLPEAGDETLSEYVALGVSHLQALLDRYHHRTAAPMDGPALKELEELQHRIDAEGGWNLERRVETLLSEMGLPAEARMKDLSGGWRRRAALARALVSSPELLLLDEPTNHLDVSAIEWLEERFQGFPGSLIFVTHDRAFLGRLATRIVELDRARLTSWPGDYASYLRRKEEALAAESRAASLFDKRLADEEAWIRQGIKARRTRNEGRVRALEAMREEYAARVAPEGKARIQIERAESSGRRVIELDQVSHSFGTDVLFQGLSLKILRGDRLGLVGNNGVGKTTLLRILLGDLEPRSGAVRLGVHLEIAYFDQLRRELDPTKTVAQVVADGSDHVTISGKDRHVIGYLKDFLFSPEIATTRVEALSGGERNRVLLARLFARPSNLLVLDEPTNDLDLETLEVLEDQLLAYEGTLIVVSHDRAFLDNVVTSTLVFEEGGAVHRYPGGYSDWLRKGHALAVKDGPGRAAAEKPVDAPPPSRTLGPAKLSYKLQRELDALPEKIETLEKKLAALEAEAALPDFYARPFAEVEPVLNEIVSTRRALEEVLERWMELESMQSGA
jgi:ATP-binding cassette subfamily F protein uup